MEVDIWSLGVTLLAIFSEVEEPFGHLPEKDLQLLGKQKNDVKRFLSAHMDLSRLEPVMYVVVYGCLNFQWCDNHRVSRVHSNE
jgi:hypothetical protein